MSCLHIPVLLLSEVDWHSLIQRCVCFFKNRVWYSWNRKQTSGDFCSDFSNIRKNLAKISQLLKVFDGLHQESPTRCTRVCSNNNISMINVFTLTNIDTKTIEGKLSKTFTSEVCIKLVALRINWYTISSSQFQKGWWPWSTLTPWLPFFIVAMSCGGGSRLAGRLARNQEGAFAPKKNF